LLDLSHVLQEERDCTPCRMYIQYKTIAKKEDNNKRILLFETGQKNNIFV